MQFNQQAINELAGVLRDMGFSTKTDVDQLAAKLVDRHARRGPSSDFSISTAIRGLAGQSGLTVNAQTREADINYVQKALATTATPGSYLVPTIQANDVIGYLSTNGILRQAGPRIWPMPGIQKLTIPTATGIPTVQYLGQNSTDTASDANLGQVSFDLKTRRSLTQLPAELLRVSTPAIDSLITELMGIGFAENEDTMAFGTTSLSNGPTCIYASAGVSTINTAGSANGGNLSYTDLLAVLAKSAAVKAKPPFCWFMSPRTFWQRVVGLLDTTSRPVFTPAFDGMSAGITPKLFGWPVFVTPFIAENEANGSGTNQSHIIYCNPKYLQVAEGDGLQLLVSQERYLEYNQIGIRGTQQHDFAVAPAAGVCILKGVN